MTVDPEHLARALFIQLRRRRILGCREGCPPVVDRIRPQRHSRDGMGGRMTPAMWFCIGFTIGAALAAIAGWAARR